MKKEIIKGHTIEFYDSIDVLPITQFHQFSKYMLLESGIGCDIEAIDTHINRIASFMRTDPKKAARELLNYRRTLFSIANGLDYRHKAFMCLVKTVDGTIWTDFTDGGIDTLYNMITTESERKMVEIESKIHSKIDEELMTYFPEIFDASVEKNYTELLRRRAFLQLAEILDGEDNTEQIQDLTDTMINFYDPKSFEGKENAEVEFDKRFEEMCLIMAKEFGGMIKGYSVMEFYSAQKLLKEQQEQLKKIKHKQ